VGNLPNELERVTAQGFGDAQVFNQLSRGRFAVRTLRHYKGKKREMKMRREVSLLTQPRDDDSNDKGDPEKQGHPARRAKGNQSKAQGVFDARGEHRRNRRGWPGHRRRENWG